MTAFRTVSDATDAAARLRGRLVERSRLDARTLDAMYRLLLAHFAGVTRAVFERDLNEKSAVVLLEDEDGGVRGFSTLLVYGSTAPGRAVTVVYSGDTIVDRTAWGSPALARTWIRSVRRLVPAGSRDVYWLLLTSGFRTYRFLPVFYRTFYPRFDEPTPAGMQGLLDALAHERFGACYDPPTGIVRFAAPQMLAGDLVDVPDSRRADPHVRFFLDRNPGYASGDELVCVTPIRDDNLTGAGRRVSRPDGA